MATELVHIGFGNILAIRRLVAIVSPNAAPTKRLVQERKSAGRIIDEAGLKGMRVGNAMVSHEHGNFIVNLGQATASDVMTLVAQIRERVPVSLELEWHLWGF